MAHFRSQWLFQSSVLLTCLCVGGGCTTSANAEQAVAERAIAKRAASTATKLRLATVFSDHMVLQRDQAVPIWGHAAPDALVRLQLSGKTYEATAAADGRWQISADPLSAGGPLEMTVESAGERLHLTDILVGDVWIASGQSNMQWAVNSSDNGPEEVAAANWPNIRLIKVACESSSTPQTEFKTKGWQVCQPATVKNFSAVAYYFGRELHERLDVPIGLVGASFGGTAIEAWISRESFESTPLFAKEAAKAKQPLPTEVILSRPFASGRNHPAGLYQSMIHPLIPYGIRGVIWYQGETNAGRYKNNPQPEHYGELLKLMIADWRGLWGRGDFPFLIVQLAGFEPGGDAWVRLCEAQLKVAQKVPHTALTATSDLGDRTDIHPTNKRDVGKRLALAARAIAYGEKIEYSGPHYRDLTLLNSQALLRFDHVGGGLTVHGDTLSGFTIAGADQKFVPAQAAIEGDRVKVWSDEVRQPTAVRYNWTSFPDGNLYNAEGLPAVQFRTDND